MCVCVRVRVCVRVCVGVCVLNKDYEGKVASIIIILSISTIMPAIIFKHVIQPLLTATTVSSAVSYLNYNGIAGKYS